jgi:DNA-directed RNA polymerase subunit M/transcription elongation factor TFIIS
MISLCSETLKLAEIKPNFSEWVRSQLLKSDETKRNQNNLIYKCSKCEYTAQGNMKMLNVEHYLVKKESTCDGIMEVLE